MMGTPGIINFLTFIHCYDISSSSLKRELRINGKKRKTLAGVKCSQRDLSNAVDRELAESSNNFTYYRIHHVLNSSGVIGRFFSIGVSLHNHS